MLWLLVMPQSFSSKKKGEDNFLCKKQDLRGAKYAENGVNNTECVFMMPAGNRGGAAAADGSWAGVWSTEQVPACEGPGRPHQFAIVAWKR